MGTPAALFQNIRASYRAWANPVARLVNTASGKRDYLSHLPLELLTEILRELEWIDVLRVRQVSRRFVGVSKQRYVWNSMYHRYVAGARIPLHLEAPLSEYSALDLEQWLLRRIGTDIAWTRNAKTPAAVRTFNFESVKSSYMTPGGRWLLLIGQHCEVMCYDLDKPKPSGELLVEGGSSCPSNILIAVDFVDPSKNRFNLALYSQHLDPSGGPLCVQETTLAIWSICLDGLRSSRPTSKLLAVHQLTGDCIKTFSISLCGELLARRPGCVRPGFCEIVNWTLDDLYLCRKIVAGGWTTVGVHVIPNNGVVVFTRAPFRVLVFDLSYISSFEGNDYRSITGTPPAWWMDLSDPSASYQPIPSPFRVHDGTTFSYPIYSQGIKQITIPHDLSKPVVSPKVCASTLRTNSPYCGLARAFFLGGGSAWLFTYLKEPYSGDWPACPQGMSASISSGEPDAPIRLKPLVDEETGRAVVLGPSYSHWHITIIDHCIYTSCSFKQ